MGSFPLYLSISFNVIFLFIIFLPIPPSSFCSLINSYLFTLISYSTVPYGFYYIFSSKFSLTAETPFKICYVTIYTVLLKSGIMTNGVWFQRNLLPVVALKLSRYRITLADLRRHSKSIHTCKKIYSLVPFSGLKWQNMV